MRPFFSVAVLARPGVTAVSPELSSCGGAGESESNYYCRCLPPPPPSMLGYKYPKLPRGKKHSKPRPDPPKTETLLPTLYQEYFFLMTCWTYCPK